ncbi:class I adenylate-forming enzyme family protein [Sporosarcina aquimarina]|uniref:class I adenylate-forming enzyme family protein n=1 Tax=Sporosarcina aquimarina TaxID=114975 RepID=UPI001C8E1079|nr:long-chain-fatty-acid--CoA ligase [Sporosarcina aquimarina]MBY0223158.1 long-chain-fatty-acid--CoA ligase [Sporosarcina aquimarina]
MEMNIGSVLRSRAIMMGEKVGFIHGDTKITFEEMNERANSFSEYLQEIGLSKGDTMAILCKNNEQAIAAFFGAAKIGVISVMVNWRLGKEELQYILSHSEAKLIVYDEVFQTTIEDLKKMIPASHYISSSTSPSFSSVWGQKTREPIYETTGNDPILIMYTSGTTGKPKGALLSHNNLLATSIGLSHTIDWRESDKFLMVAPFFHIGGLAPLITNVHTGAAMILMEDFNPTAAWKLIESERITTMMTVPAMLTFLLKTYPAVSADISSLRNITCGASAVPAPLILQFREMGIPVQQVYGITEYAGAVTLWKETQHPDKYDSMGKPVMHGTLRIADTDSKETLPNGEIGEIIIGGPQVFVGYYKNEEAYMSTVIDGEFHTGDIGYIDEQGFLYVVDRLKDLIISGGENIYSSELEQTLAQHPAVADVAVVGVVNEQWGEVPKAFIVKAKDVEVSVEDIIEFSKEKLASYKAVKEVVFVDQLPRNAVGKILKQRLKEMVSI